jgi:hypothetical protein
MLSDVQLVELANHLGRFITFRSAESGLWVEGCDNTLAHTTDWLKSKGLDVDATLDWLRGEGGYCDCEVILNVVTPIVYPDSVDTDFE